MLHVITILSLTNCKSSFSFFGAEWRCLYCSWVQYDPHRWDRTFLESYLKAWILGSAEIAHKSRKNEDHSPCFLVPTCSMSEFMDSTYKSHREAIKSGQKRGDLLFIWLVCCLLVGHHVAAAWWKTVIPLSCWACLGSYRNWIYGWFEYGGASII